ncbi:unnamed protein product [Staurois parvus]|uniref:Cytochrome oxidase subunit 1 n=1 Tax=Staurois parvus TaxID=386267 RepID=A0ABN9CN84_9NEOB|nr:unnamed protein product [Staurois parvus]
MLLYISCPHQSAPLHKIFLSDTPFYHTSPSECPFTSYSL